MLAREIMSRHPDAVSDNMTLSKAAIEMQKHDCGFLPVKHDGQITGVVTDRDIIVRALAKGLDPNKATLEQIMSKHLFFCHEDDNVKKVADMMCDKQVHRIAIYDKNEQLSGVVSIGDIARKCKDTAMCGKLTEAIHKE
jgi:CBS domain-containing protein